MVVFPWVVGAVVSYCLWSKADTAQKKADQAMQLVAEADSQNRSWTQGQVISTVREALMPSQPAPETGGAGIKP